MNISKLIGIVALSFIATITHAAESASVLLQKGIFAEETEGDLKAAISIYEQVVKEAEGTRVVAAQALYRLGLCHKKLGNKEGASLIFRRLIVEYSGENALVQQALAQLPASERPGEPVKMVQLPTPPSGWVSEGLSPDGTYVAFGSGGSSELSLLNAKTGQTHLITTNSARLWYAGRVVFSPDGSQIGYATGIRPAQIYLSSTARPEPKEIMPDTNRFWIYLTDWSPDGKAIAAEYYSGEDRRDIALIDLEHSRIDRLRQITSGTIPGDVFRPHGQAPSISAGGQEGQRIIHLALECSDTGGKAIRILSSEAVGWLESRWW